MVKSFAPLVWENPRLLLLGSMPGVQSLSQSQYYAHPQNQFWRILATAFGQTVPETYAEKQLLLARNHVALWDVLEDCQREGSLDSNIKNAHPNAIPAFLKHHPSIEKIGFNGQLSLKFFVKSFPNFRDLPLTLLPSTSPAYTIPLAKKLDPWKEFLL